MSLCIAAGGTVVVLAAHAFTLGWTHSIEKVRWEEDYVVEADRLRLVEARIHGSGAGMEPPDGSRLAHGVWHYVPKLAPLPVLRLTHSNYVAGYELCLAGRCAPLTRYAPGAQDGAVIEIRPCDDDPH